MTNDKTQRRFRRPKFSNVIALVALFAVLGGSAYAGGKLINGKKIKKGTVTSKQLKNETIKTKDISEAAVADLQGQQGPQGPEGPEGPQGPAGVVEPHVMSDNAGANLPDGSAVELGSLVLVSPNQYVLQGKVQVFGGPNVDTVVCRLEVGGSEADRATWNPPADNTRTTLSLLAVDAAEGDDAAIECEADGGTGNASFVRLVALPTTAG